MSDSVLQVHVKLLWTKQKRIKCYFNLSLLGLQGGAGTYPSYHRATGRVHPGHGAPWTGVQSDTGLTNKNHTHIHTCGKVVMISGRGWILIHF